MEILLALALIAFSPQQAAMPSATGTLKGKIVRASTQEPIAGVEVMLLGGPNATPPQFIPDVNGAVRIDFGDGRIINAASIAVANNLIANRPPSFDFGGMGTQRAVVTNNDGSYVFNDLAPGRYSVRVQREGYFGPVVNGNAMPLVSRLFTVEGRKTVTEDFALVKGGVIFGKIRRPDGQPQARNFVFAGRQGYSNGRPILLTAMAGRSDDQGEYRFFYLPPGEYVVGVSPEPPDMTERVQDEWINVFYPGTTDVTQSVSLRLDEGQELGFIDLTLQKASAPSYKFTGRIENIPSSTPRSVGTGMPADGGYPELSLRPRELGPLDTTPIPPFVLTTANSVLPSGEFTIRNVRPGLYDLFAWMQHAPPNRDVNWSGNTVVEVKNADVQGGELHSVPEPSAHRQHRR